MALTKQKKGEILANLEKLAKANPKLTMSSFKEGENPFERPLF